MVGTYKSLSYWHIHIHIEISKLEILKFNRMYVEKLTGKYFSVVHIHYKIMYRQESWIFQRMHLGNDRLTSSRRNSWKEDIYWVLTKLGLSYCSCVIAFTSKRAFNISSSIEGNGGFLKSSLCIPGKCTLTIFIDI